MFSGRMKLAGSNIDRYSVTICTEEFVDGFPGGFPDDIPESGVYTP
jgi:hypothetical protein